MDFHLLRDVRESDGAKLGELRHVVVDSETMTAISLVVQQTGAQGHALIVPIGAVERSDEDAVYLFLSPEEFDSLPTYAYGQNVAPPPADLDPETVPVDQIDEPVSVPEVPPVGAATGITSIAFTPIMEVWRNVPEGAAILDDGTVVLAIDGEIGHLDHVLTEESTHRIDRLLVKGGLVFTEDIEIPAAWIQTLQGERIQLNVTKAQAQVTD